MNNRKHYIQIEGQDYIEFRCSKCGSDESLVTLPKKEFDNMEEVICYRCCSTQSSGC